MADSTMRDLDGEDDDEAQTWLRDFTKYVTMMSLSVASGRLDEVKASAFGAHIARGSEAEAWYKGLTANQRGSWASLLVEFEIRWPARPAIVKTIKDHLDEFHACVLAADEVLTRVPTGVNNQTQWAFVLFGDKLRRLGTKTTLPLAALIIDAKEQMPDVLVRLMQPHSAVASWSAWCAALMTLDPETIKLELARTAELEERINRLELATKALEEAKSRPYQPRQNPVQTSYQQPPRFQAQYQPVYQQPQTNAPALARPSPLHAARQAPQPVTTPQFLSVQPPQPPSPNPFYTVPPPQTPQNTARVNEERREWAQRWPDGMPFATRGYPLTPGTAPAVTGCTRCGEPETPTHNNLSCTNAPLDSLEQRFRINVRQAVRKANRPQSATIPRNDWAFRGGGQLLSARSMPALGRGGWSAPSTPTPSSPHHGRGEQQMDLHQIEMDAEVDYSLEPEGDEEPLNGGEVQ